MKLAVVIEKFDPAGGGAERSTAQIVEALRVRGHDVTVLAGLTDDGVAGDEPIATAASSEVSMRCCPTGPPNRWWRIGRFVDWVHRQYEEGGYELSLAMSSWLPADVLQPRSGLLAEARLRNIERRRSASSRFYKRFEYAVAIKQRIMLSNERRLLGEAGGARHIVAISDYMAEQIARHYPSFVAGESSDGADHGPRRVSLIRNGSEVAEHDDSRRAMWRRDMRRAFSVPEGVTTFLFLANDPARKGIGPLLEAMCRLVQSGTPATLLLAGDIGYSTQERCAKLGIRDHVRFIGATQSPEPFYAAADVTVLPSYYDPASKVVIESLLMGRPAITSAYNGARDFIDGPIGVGHGNGDQRTPRGRVVDEPGDVQGLAAAMAELCDGQERLRCVDAIGPVRDQLTMNRHVDELDALLRRLVARAPAS